MSEEEELSFSFPPRMKNKPVRYELSSFLKKKTLSKRIKVKDGRKSGGQPLFPLSN